MPSPRLVFSPAFVACALVLVGCQNPKPRIRKTVESTTSDGITVVGGDLRRALCGWLPPRGLSMSLTSSAVDLEGDNAAGTGTLDATLVADGGLRCSGRASFTYARYEAHGVTSFPLAAIHRVGALAPSVDAALRVSAVKIQLGAPVPVSLRENIPGFGAVKIAICSFELPARGRYDIRATAPEPFDPAVTIYQHGASVIDPGGALDSVVLDPGPAWVLLASETVSASELTVRPSTH